LFNFKITNQNCKNCVFSKEIKNEEKYIIVRYTEIIYNLYFFNHISGIFNAQQMPEQFREEFASSFPIRSDQHLEIKAYADELLQERIKESLASFKPDYFSIEDYQNSLYPSERGWEILWLSSAKSVKGNIVKFVKVGEDVNCTIYRVWIEVIEGVNAYGIYMVPKNIRGKLHSSLLSMEVVAIRSYL